MSTLRGKSSKVRKIENEQSSIRKGQKIILQEKRKKQNE